MNDTEIFELTRRRIAEGYPISAALGLAQHFHLEQIDKQGERYIHHVTAVARAVDETHHDLILSTAAYLHDIVEDTPVTLQDLSDLGFHPLVVDTVDALTRRKGEEYPAFIRRVSRHPQAVWVKIADVNHNLDGSRGPIKPQLQQRYIDALGVLTRAVNRSRTGPEEL